MALQTYGRVVDKEINVEAEGDGDWDKTDKLIQLDLASLLPWQLFNLDPVGHLRDEALSFVSLICSGAGARRAL